VGCQVGNAVEGSDNIYIGDLAGDGIAAESGTIRIGNETFVSACYIAGILKNGPFGADVQIDPVTGQLGSNASSERFKKDIDPMDKTSEAIYSLKPVTFRYKNDKTNTPQFGLIAEHVAKVNPALIAVDKEGKPYTVRYHQINAVLLNEFLKEHKKGEEQDRKLESQARRIQQQEDTIEYLKREVETLVDLIKEHDSKIQRVIDQVEVNKTAPQLVASHR
jgi:endosialidase-like protein